MTPAPQQPRIEAYIGASGSGKGVSLSRRLAELRPDRLVIWDPRDEYGKAATRCATLAELVAARRRGGEHFRVRYVHQAGSLDDAFAWLCRWVFELGAVVFVAEELSDVTTAGHAPADWRRVITQGRHRGLHVLAAAQRPALIDKTLLGNCTYLRCFTLRYLADRRAMAAAMDVPEAQIAELVTTEAKGATTINYLERDFREGYTRAGRIRLHR